VRLLTRQVIGFAQTWISVLFLVGYFWVFFAFVKGEVKPPTEWHDIIGTLLGVLTSGVGAILHFWFSRSRPDEPKDAGAPPPGQ
jgi:hypothetical protein